MRLVPEIRRDHENYDCDDRKHRRTDAHHEEDLATCARGSLPQQRSEKSTKTCCQHRCRSIDCQQQSEDKGDAEKRVHLVLLAQLSFLFLDQAIEFVEQFSISFADRVDDAGEHWFNLVGAVTQ